MTNQNIYGEAGTYNGIFVQKIVGRKFESQDSYTTDDDISAISESDSDILEPIRKADVVDFGQRFLNVGWL